ncbi:MAG: TIGR04282 family arsenosugar biosynthesis glycosyltransferase [Deferribacterales bacterium]
MTNDTAVAIFCKYPEDGRVKTRLAKDIGCIKAVEVYKFLLNNTLKMLFTIEDLTLDLFIFIDNKDDTLKFNNYMKIHFPSFFYKVGYQIGDDLGERLFYAFESLFKNRYNKVIIVGSDIVGDLKTECIRAVKCLDTSDLVIGPSYDGGFYLLGAKNNIPKELLNDIQWSTESVFESLLYNINSLSFSYSLIDPLYDIDTIDDLKKAMEYKLLPANISEFII